MSKNIINSEKKQECIAYALNHPEINAKQLAPNWTLTLSFGFKNTDIF
jgi:hypothetical protein